MKRPFWFSHESIFEPRDLWVGVYWKRYPCALEVYFAPLPIFVTRFYFQWN